MDAVHVRTLPPPPIEEREILRYAGGDTPEIRAQIGTCLARAREVLAYRVCFRIYPILRREGELELGFARTASADLRRNLAECTQVILFAATVGVGIDRLIRRSAISPAQALFYQAIGTERIESLCDAFCREMGQRYSLRPRFSPGYGDLPLTMQRDIFAALDCPRHIGVTLRDSCMMIPSKSVTAIVGVKDRRIDE